MRPVNGLGKEALSITAYKVVKRKTRVSKKDTLFLFIQTS